MNTEVRSLLESKGHSVFTIHPTATVHEAVAVMDENTIGTLIVMEDNGDIAGIMSERDCFRKVILVDRATREVKIEEIMTPRDKLITVGIHESLVACMELMTKQRVRHLPVLDEDGSLAGLVSIGDVVKFLCREEQVLIDDLERYISGSL